MGAWVCAGVGMWVWACGCGVLQRGTTWGPFAEDPCTAAALWAASEVAVGLVPAGGGAVDKAVAPFTARPYDVPFNKARKVRNVRGSGGRKHQ